jgi:UPF0716 protein FxsA
MAILLLATFIAVPIIEIGLFIEIGGWIGLWPTIGIVIITAFAGTTLLRLQGLSVLKRVQGSINKDELPVQEVFDGLCLIVAGLFLLTPGFFTDSIGFLLFLPLFRRFACARIWRWLLRSGKLGLAAGVFNASSRPDEGSSARDGAAVGPIVDGKFEEVDPSPQDRIGTKDGR